jgi:hypothetical protein
MSDESEITALVHEYARRLDSGNLDGVAALFESAVWRSPGRDGALEGSVAIRRIYDGVHLYEDGTPRTKHLITNLTIDVDEPGENASSHCYVTVIQGITPGDNIDIVLSAQYVDKFGKTDGSWHFLERVMVGDLTGDLSRHYG